MKHTIYATAGNFKIVITVLMVLSGMGLWSAFAFAQSEWQARLTPNPVSFGTRETITGLGEVTATLDNNTLTLIGTFHGLQGKVTAVKLHRGPKAIPGPELGEIEFQISGDGKAGAINDIINLTDAQRQALLAEGLYIQLYSEAAKDGNLRGWLLPRNSNK